MKKEVLVQFGNRVRELRTKNGWSQEKLAEKTGFHRTYIGMVERAERNPTLINLKEFAKAFDISLSNLFEFESIDN